jgi:ABC-type glycerol-3-phosphate transport system substrate-binding protein
MIHIFRFQEEPDVNDGKFSRRQALRVGLMAAAAAATLGLAACGGGEEGEDDPQVRFVNATVDFANATFWVNGSSFPGTRNIPNGGGFTSYDFVSAGSRQIGVGPVNQSASLTVARNFAKETSTTAIAMMGTGSDEEFLFLEENGTAPSTGQVRLRVLNATTNTGYDVYVQSTAPASGNSPMVVGGYGNLTNFTDRASGSLRVYVTNRNNLTVIFQSNPVTFTSRSVGTLAIVPFGSGFNVVALEERGNAVRLTNQLP